MNSARYLLEVPGDLFSAVSSLMRIVNPRCEQSRHQGTGWVGVSWSICV